MTITLHALLVGHLGAYVAIALTPEGAAKALATEAAEEGHVDTSGAYPMTITVPRVKARDTVRFLLGGYGDEHAERVWRALSAAT